MNFDIDSYVTVQERVAEFYRDFPEGSIRTYLAKIDGPEVVFEARVFRTPAEANQGIYTSGWAREIEGLSPVNRTSHLENCESGAIGRALANLGYAKDAKRPSRSEIIKVGRMRQEHEAMLEYVRTVGAAADETLEIEYVGSRHNVKKFIRDNWTAMKAQYRLARAVVTALEAATGTTFLREAA